MRNHLLTLLVALTVTFAAGAPAWAQSEAPAPPVPQKNANPGVSHSTKLIPKLEFRDVPLSEVLNILRDADPDFQAIVSGPGSEDGGPTIQELRLKNVSAASVLRVLGEAYPQIRVDAMQPEDGTPMIWSIHVLGPEQPAGGSGPGLYGPAGEMGMGGETAGTQTVTTVHRLREIIDDLARDGRDAPENRKKACEAVLSLVQATIETQGGGKSPATIKLHEATETLVFKGTAMQAGFVEQALSTLTPVVGDSGSNSEMRREIKALTEQVRELKMRLNENPENALPQRLPGAADRQHQVEVAKPEQP